MAYSNIYKRRNLYRNMVKSKYVPTKTKVYEQSNYIVSVTDRKRSLKISTLDPSKTRPSIYRPISTQTTPRYIVWGRLYDGTKIAVSSGKYDTINKETTTKLKNAFLGKLGMEYNHRVLKRASGYDAENAKDAVKKKIKHKGKNVAFLTWYKSGWLYFDKKG